jgi:polar amino acid transport system ATP-binding protein
LRLKIASLFKRYGTHPALNGLSLEVPEFHSLALIGPSGGGKTTLLRILAGLERPDSGEVELNGERIRFDHQSILQYRRTVGVVFQAFNLFPHLTALENVTLPLEKVHGYAPDAARAAAIEWLRRFQLDAHAGKRPGALSGGQRQRVAIARAVAIRPRVLLFDEPTSALDPEMTAEVLDCIRQLLDTGCDLILVTHEMGFARGVADRTAFLADGRVVEFGETKALFAAPASEACRRFLATVLKY